MMNDQMPMGFTQLDPVQQLAFLAWYQQMAQRAGLNPDPYNPRHHYDYAAAWLGGAQPGADMHWPSQYKMAGHPNRFVPMPQGMMLDSQQNVLLGNIRQKP